MPGDQEHATPNESTRLIIREEFYPRERRETLSSRIFWRIGALYGALAVALAAYGAHGLRSRTSDSHKLENWTTAANFHVGASLAIYKIQLFVLGCKLA
jgi:hypothetical protein